MNSMFNFIVIILVLICSVSIGVGINLKKWYGWAQVIAGFMLGLFMAKNPIEGIVPGIFLALLMIWLGPIMWRRRHS